MSTLLLRNGVVHTPVGPASLVAVEDGSIVHVGTDDAAGRFGGADEVVDLDGALVAPAFVDAHIHTVQTGFLLTQLDLRRASSLREALDQVARAARQGDPDEVLVGTGWDDSSWPERRAPSAAEIEVAAPGRRVLLTRLDGHSAVLSPVLMEAIEGLEAHHGYGASGHMTLDAMQHTTENMGLLIGAGQRFAAARAAVLDLAAQGVAAFHENAAPHIGPAYEIALVREAAQELGLLPTFYWGEYGAVDRARQLGAAGLAGDLNADGSIGSRTAALHSSYDDRPGHTGHAYLTPEEIADHVVLCTQEKITGGFHCIGEAGLTSVTEGFRLAEKRIGADAIRAGRHRLEHIEMPDDAAVAMIAELGLSASMQPLFDELWGGPDKMYAERLGGRWRGMNPIGRLHRAGVNVALGSDSPVTEPRPWRAVRAATRHHEEEQRVSREDAFTMHTVGGWRAQGDDSAGRIEVGAPAHLAVWRGDLVGTLPDLESAPVAERLVVGGSTVWRAS